MDFYQSVVTEYLRADRARFVNTEYCIQLKDGNPDTSGPQGYRDAVALDFRSRTIWLCEISHARTLGALRKRLDAWQVHWDEIHSAVKRLSQLEKSCQDWTVKPWLFVPEKSRPLLEFAKDRFKALGAEPKITYLEDVEPWKFPAWDRTPPCSQTETQTEGR